MAGTAYPQTREGKRMQVARQMQRRAAYKSLKPKYVSGTYQTAVVSTATQRVR